MAKITGLDSLIAKLSARIRAVLKPTVVVGYTQQYALYVHEDLEARHPVGQAKFLEQPARQMGKVLGSKVSELVRRGLPFNRALLIAGLDLQKASQQLVPVDTGALKGSAFTREE